MKLNQAGLLALVMTTAFSFRSEAQLKFPVSNSPLRKNLESVISDFPYQFAHLKGEVVYDNPQTVEYASKLNFPEAEGNQITEYKSNHPLYSWQAQLLTTEDYETAAKKYKWLFRQLKTMTVTLTGGYSYTMDGKYEETSESSQFSTSVLHLTPQASGMGKLRIEAHIEYEMPEWKVSLLVYEKEREDDQRGPRYEKPFSENGGVAEN